MPPTHLCLEEKCNYQKMVFLEAFPNENSKNSYNFYNFCWFVPYTMHKFYRLLTCYKKRYFKYHFFEVNSSFQIDVYLKKVCSGSFKKVDIVKCLFCFNSSKNEGNLCIAPNKCQYVIDFRIYVSMSIVQWKNLDLSSNDS